MEKTIEYMRTAVLAECEAVCPSRLYAPIECGHLAFGYVEDDGIRMEAWFLYVGEATAPMSLYALAGEQVWLAAYRLLSLSERAAVEAEKARLLKRYKARIKRLRADDAETHRIQMEVKDERIAALEAKNAALVAALESLKRAVGYKPRRHGEIVLYRNDLGVFIDNTLAANEKGGVQG